MANPNGRKGSKKHQNVQKAEKTKLSDDLLTIPGAKVKMEVPVSTPNGKKQHRVADVAAFSITDKMEFHKIVQVGKTNKSGKPVKREQEAIDDIEKHTGLKVKFVDYEAYNLDDDGKTA